MNALLLTPALALATLLPGPQAEPAVLVPVEASAYHLPAAGTFTQTGITSLEAKTVGPITIIDQESTGDVTGTLSGTFEDNLKVVILPNGSFIATFQLTVDCAVDGAQGVLTLQAADVGQIVDSTTAEFVGVAAITDATGELDGMTGVLEIEGTVDLVSGLSTYSYEGDLGPSK